LCTLILFNNACSRVHNIIYDILHMQESKCNSVEVLSFKEINTLQDTSIFYPLAAKYWWFIILTVENNMHNTQWSLYWPPIVYAPIKYLMIYVIIYAIIFKKNVLPIHNYFVRSFLILYMCPTHFFSVWIYYFPQICKWTFKVKKPILSR